MIIAIDGPVGSGKSTVARLVAKKTGYACLDTGAMYRAIGWKAQTTGTPLDEENLARLCSMSRIEIELSEGAQKIMVDGRDVSLEIRMPEISRMASIVSRFASVRRYLVDLQRKTGLQWESYFGGVVIEGRDIGTAVFPDAPLKIYLDADIQERGKRRWRELQDKGLEVDLDETVEGIKKRDESDAGRQIDPLRKANDAVVIDTTGLVLEEVVEKIVKEIRRRSCHE